VDDFIKVAGGEDAKTWIEAGGALDGGRKVWLLVHLEDDMFVAGEKLATYLLFSNAHDGRGSLIVALVTVRVVCQNTLTWALQTAPRVFRVRHTKNANQRVKQAVEIFGMRNRHKEELAKQGEWLVEQSMSDADFDGFLESLMPIKEDAEGTPAATMITDRRNQVRNLYTGAVNLDPIRGTRWGALQATVEYADYGRTFKTDESQLKAQFGMNEQAILIKNNAATILTDPKMKPIKVAA
jgi:phage/plasmid-like protein (TIGR03299 family)